MVEFDTKDIRYITSPGHSFVNSWIMNKENKAWMKDVNFGVTINKILQKLPKYGNHLIKTVGDKPFEVRLKDMVIDPYVEFAEQSYIVDEVRYMAPHEVEAMKGWDKEIVKEVVELAKKEKKSLIQIDEAYFPNEKKLVIIAGLDNHKQRTSKTAEDNVANSGAKILFDGSYTKFPYTEFFWDNYQGRYLRQGVLEELLEEQFAANEMFFLHMMGLYWSQKHVFKTTDMMINRNIMRDVENGDILRVNGELVQLDVADRDLGAVNNTTNLIDKNKREKAMIFEPITGETLPSATPFRLGFILQKAGAGYFDQKREDIGLQLKKYITQKITPTFKNSKRKKHLFNFTGVDNELASMEKLMIEMQLQKAIKAYPSIPTQEQVQRERERLAARLQARPDRTIKIPANFYENIKHKVELVITGESVNLGSMIETLTTLLQTIATNPGVLQDPNTRKILFATLDKAGISPEEIGLDVQPQQGLTPDAINRFSPPPGGKSRGGLSIEPKNTTL